MAASPSRQLQTMLQTAVQAVQWTYSLFWQLCPQQRMLVWGDGYYNGAIKTRKTVQPMEVSAEEASLQRSQQLRELYESLSTGDQLNQPARRPSAALSPEDLTELEWFYLMCVSFSFSPGVGLPGKAYTKRQHVWLVTGANEEDSKVFSRAILAKSAGIKTVVCIPLLDGVVELGTTEMVQENLGFVQHVKTFFTDESLTQPPKPALSEHSISNLPATSSQNSRLHPPSMLAAIYAHVDSPANANQIDDDGEDEEEEEELNSEGDMHNSCGVTDQGVVVAHAAAEPIELIQLDMSEDFWLGSPDDASINNKLEEDFHLQAAAHHQRQVDSCRPAESSRMCPLLQRPLNHNLQPQNSGALPLEEFSQEDTHYTHTVSAILHHHQSIPWSKSPSTHHLMYSTHSAFCQWPNRSDHHHYLLHDAVKGTSQWLLKYILFTVPFLHNKCHYYNSPRYHEANTATNELSANHVLAERRRRQKLNERFILLRSLVPFVTKMDEASILGDTIVYVQQLRRKIHSLEALQIKMDQRSRLAMDPQRTTGLNLKDKRSGVTLVDKRELRRIGEGSGGAKPEAVESPPPHTVARVGLEVQVSIIESNALVELQCPYREGLLLDVMQMLWGLLLEITTVQSSLTHGVFVVKLRAKVKENAKGKKPNIMEVKRAIHKIILPK
ncbi:transcription factor BHLH42-like isoform X2 [Cornus florida]|uniref:transcription factor BHLH42-like isoform X2 n=1 Tax=Cornus florida TaxID=4283 RepID=UPI00289EDAFD|nr:transcription factor BHLH42-like isoform X2 [Cornus florida]